MIDIKTTSNLIRFSTPINDGSKRKFLLMKEDYITLKFSLKEPIYFHLGDGIDNELGIFELVDLYKPSYNESTGGYDYELRFDAYYWKWKNKKFFYTPESSGREASWNLTATLDVHLKVFIDNLKALGYKFRDQDFTWEIDDTVADASKLVSYNNVNLIDALTQMAETWECEWWIDHHNICFGRCEFSSPVDFKVGDLTDTENVNVNSMKRSDSQTTYATRVYAFGSTRNIPASYRKSLIFDATVDNNFISDTFRILNDNFFPIGSKITPNPIENKHLSTLYDITDGSLKVNGIITANTSKATCAFDMTTLEIKVASRTRGSDDNFIPVDVNIKISFEMFYGDPYWKYIKHTVKSLENVSIAAVGNGWTVINAKDIFSIELEALMSSASLCVDFYNIDGTQFDGRLDVSVIGDLPVWKERIRYNTSVTFLSGTNEGNGFNCFYFPDISGRKNVIQLPENVIVTSGDRYTINNIIKGKVPDNYFSKDDKELTLNGVVQQRLMLPADIPYVDAYRYNPTGERIDIGDERYDNPDNVEMPKEEAIEEIIILEDEYPKYDGTIYSVDKRTEKDDDGNETENEYLSYTFKDTGLKNFTEDFRIKGEELRIAFQTGKLAGLDFALNIKESDDTGTTFEIVRNEDYGRFLPDDVLFPQAAHTEGGKPVSADTYILHGFDTAFVSEQMLPDSEQALLKNTKKRVKKSMIDPSTYDCDMDVSYIYNEGNIRTFEVGDKVNLINKAYFPNGRQSRIIGFEWPLDIPYDHPVYTVGETAAYSRIGEIESKIDSLTYKGQTYSGSTVVGGGPSVYVIGVNDKTLPSDRNVFSSKRSQAEFLSKAGPDQTNHLLKLLGGAHFGNFTPGWLGSGSAITVDEKTGKTRLEVDEVLARDRIEAIEYRFNRVEVIEGEQWSTFAFGTIRSVDVENQIAYLDLVDGELMSSHKNDLNRGIFHNISSANASESKIDDCGFYTQSGFSTSYFTPTELLAKGNGFKYALRAGTSQHPCAGMKFAAYGNPTDPSRRMSRVTNLKHTIYLKDVSVWQIDTNVHYGAAYGDLTGITINGVEFNGYSSFQTNGYFKGHIEFLPEQKEELKGKDGYSVSLSSYDAVVAVNSDGEIDSSLYDIINIVSGNESAYTDGNQIVATKYKIQTTIQAICGAVKLEQSDVIGAGKYVVSATPVGCEYHLSDGVITITKITQDKATLDIEINCEGIALVKKIFTLTRVYAERGFTGADGKDIEFIYLRSKVDKAPVPASENVDGFIPEGWTDNPTGTTSEFIYELISRRIKVNGTWAAFSHPAPWARYAKDGKNGDSVTAKYSINGTDWHDGFADGDIYMQLYTNGVASGSINRIVAEDGKNGQYTSFEFAKSASTTVAPSDGWQDAPPEVPTSEFLWMRSGLVIPPEAEPKTWTAVRIGGINGSSVDVEYSVDGVNWHALFAAGDLYMRQRIGEGEWTSAFRIVGETGKNGQYTDYQFAANESLTDAPASGWQDAPPVVYPGQYLWMRSGVVTPPDIAPKTWTAVRIGGQKGDDGKDGPGFEIVFCRTKTNTAPDKPTGKNQDQYVPDGWTNDQAGTSALWPHEFASQRRKTNGIWGSFSEPALWANYSFDGDDAYSVALSSYDAVVSVNSAGEIDSSLYDVVNVVSGQQLAHAGTYEVTTTKYKIQTAIYAWHGATPLVHSDTASSGKYTTTIEAVGCEYSIANGVITITRISQDKATLDIVVNCEGKITVHKTFTLTRVYAGQDANMTDWLKPWDDNKTMIDGEWVASPKMFSGTRNLDTGKLTGIAHGRDCITIDGVKRTGIFALVDDEVVFELDPINKKYKFKGRVEADEGTFIGEVNAKSGEIAGFTIYNGVLENKEEGDENEMLLSRGLIRFLNSYASVFLGADTFPSIGGGSLVTPMRIAVDRNTDETGVGNTGIHLSVTGAKAYDDMVYTGNSALYIPEGRISGFRLRQRRLSSSQTLSKMDSIILSIAQNDVTYTLPSECEDGQLIIIKKHGGGNVRVNAASGDSISQTFDRRVQSTDFGKGYCLQFCYDSVNKSWWMVDTADQWK